LTFEIRNCKCEWRNARDVGLRDRNNAVSFDWYTGVQRAKTPDVCIARVKGQVKAWFAISIDADVNWRSMSAANRR
jgi:hypothetical protein